jgi:hypothetical protein
MVLLLHANVTRYAYGMVEELDVPGEWVLDAATNTVSAILPDGCIAVG